MIVSTLDKVLAAKKIKLKDLAAQMGITYQTISLMKQGKTKSLRLHLLDKYCSLLNCNIGDLYKYIPDDELDQFFSPATVNKLLRYQKQSSKKSDK